MQMFASDFVYKIETIEFAINNQVDNRFQMFHWVLWIFKQYCDALDFCIPIVQFDGKFVYYKKLWYSLNCHYTRWKQLHFTDCFHYCRRRDLRCLVMIFGKYATTCDKKAGSMSYLWSICKYKSNHGKSTPWLAVFVCILYILYMPHCQ